MSEPTTDHGVCVSVSLSVCVSVCLFCGSDRQSDQSPSVCPSVLYSTVGLSTFPAHTPTIIIFPFLSHPKEHIHHLLDPTPFHLHPLPPSSGLIPGPPSSSPLLPHLAFPLLSSHDTLSLRQSLQQRARSFSPRRPPPHFALLLLIRIPIFQPNSTHVILPSRQATSTSALSPTTTSACDRQHRSTSLPPSTSAYIASLPATPPTISRDDGITGGIRLLWRRHG